MLLHEVHGYGVGRCWGEREPGKQGWYRALIESLITNTHALEGRYPRRPPWWKRYVRDGFYPLIDAGLVVALVGTVVVAVC